MKAILLSVGAACALIAAPANAGSIIGTGQPSSNAALAGGTVVDFESATDGSASSRTFGDLTVTGVSTISSMFGGQYNTTGKYLHNNGGNTNSITFTFANAISAFGLNIGAADLPFTLSAGGQTYTFSQSSSFSNDKGFWGISDLNTSTATLSFGSGDYVLLDNVTFKSANVTSAVPEPATWAMMLIGFGGIGATMRRRKQTARILFA